MSRKAYDTITQLLIPLGGPADEHDKYESQAFRVEKPTRGALAATRWATYQLTGMPELPHLYCIL